MSPRRPPCAAARVRAAGALLVLAGLTLSSCAYYNTYYLARKYYDTATQRTPYLVDKPANTDVQSFNKSIEYSKKVLAQYPKSKWVDDAYLLWARSLLGKDDPLQTINMLQDFTQRYPRSSVAAEARFYLGVGYRQARKYRSAVDTLQQFLALAPKHALAPYANLELARALGALNRWSEAAAAAGRIIERWPRSGLLTQARMARAEAEFKQRDFPAARNDYITLGREARNDEERLTFLFREADCLEAARSFDEELTLLKGAQSHEVPPPSRSDVGPGQPQPPPPPDDRYGRIAVRIGTASLLAGRLDDALTAYRSVVNDYPRTPLAAEAQYRVGYAFETVGDDFTKAGAEYAKVKDIANSVFVTQANQRLENLTRLTQYKGGGRDTLESRAQAGFMLAEQYLFQLDKPDRAIENYEKIRKDLPGTAWEAKAMLAEGWVLARKLEREASAESLWWKVVREHPATEAQIAARDYLELAGQSVPDSLIKLPEAPLVATLPDSALSQPPTATDSLGPGRGRPVLGPGGRIRPPGADEDDMLRRRRPLRPGSTLPDSSATRDSTLTTRPDSTATTPPDTTRSATPPDTTRRPRPASPADTTRARSPYER